jgi:LPXTG-motif cell wall-anchored protein
MTQDGGFDFLIAWTIFVALLLVLAALIVRRRRR